MLTFCNCNFGKRIIYTVRNRLNFCTVFCKMLNAKFCICLLEDHNFKSFPYQTEESMNSMEEKLIIGTLKKL